MSENKRIESGDGDEITVSLDDNHVVIGIVEALCSSRLTIWLTPEQCDELVREIGLARVEPSKARP